MRLPQILLVALMIIMYGVWLHRHRQISQSIIYWNSVHNRGFELADEINRQFTSAQDSLWQAVYARVNTEHMHYEVGDDQLPGVLTVKCLDCEETIGTTAGGEPPIPLVTAHVQQKFDEICEKAFKVSSLELLKHLESKS